MIQKSAVKMFTYAKEERRKGIETDQRLNMSVLSIERCQTGPAALPGIQTN